MISIVIESISRVGGPFNSYMVVGGVPDGLTISGLATHALLEDINPRVGPTGGNRGR